MLTPWEGFAISLGLGAEVLVIAGHVNNTHSSGLGALVTHSFRVSFTSHNSVVNADTKMGHLLVDLLANTAALHRQAIRVLMSERKLGWAAAAVCEGSFGCVELFLGRCEQTPVHPIGH